MHRGFSSNTDPANAHLLVTEGGGYRLDPEGVVQDWVGGVDNILRSRLAPEGSVHCCRQSPGPTLLRVLFDIVDASLLGVSSVGARDLLITADVGPNLRQCAALSLLAICLAIAGRRVLRPRGGSLFEPAWQHAAIAAVATGSATTIVGFWWFVFFADPSQSAGASDDPTMHGFPLASWVVAWSGLSACGSMLASLLASAVARIRQVAPMRLAVVGSGPSADSIVQDIEQAPRTGWRCVYEADDSSWREMSALADLIAHGEVDAVVLAMVEAESTRIEATWRHLADGRAPICVGLDPGVVGDIPTATCAAVSLPLQLQLDPFAGTSGVIKRIVDVIGSGVLLVLLAPLLIGAAVTIRMESPGPVLFKQWRFGLASRPIKVLKFRTMYVNQGDPTGERQISPRDGRVTSIGQFLRTTSIDELPQLFNVFRGDMSLVGPRPHPMHMKIDGEYYFEALPGYRRRHRVRPGITGWAQVNGSRGSVATMEQARRRLELDLQYVNHWSLWLDLVIMARTLRRRVIVSGA